MGDNRRTRRPPPVGTVRRTDIDPYTALRWVGSLFKGAAVFLAVAVFAEFIAGLRLEGLAALPLLLGELARTAVLAVVLWGGGDLVRLLIQLGNDVRAERILLARLTHRLPRPDGTVEPETPEEAATADAAGSIDPLDDEPPRTAEAAD